VNFIKNWYYRIISIFKVKSIHYNENHGFVVGDKLAISSLDGIRKVTVCRVIDKDTFEVYTN
jgi:hypothetical protein